MDPTQYGIQQSVPQGSANSIKQLISNLCSLHSRPLEFLYFQDTPTKNHFMCSECVKDQSVIQQSVLQMSLLLNEDKNNIEIPFPVFTDPNLLSELQNIKDSPKEIEGQVNEYFADLEQGFRQKIEIAKAEYYKKMNNLNRKHQMCFETFKKINEIDQLKSILSVKSKNQEDQLHNFIVKHCRTAQENTERLQGTIIDYYNQIQNFSLDSPNLSKSYINKKVAGINFFEGQEQRGSLSTSKKNNYYSNNFNQANGTYSGAKSQASSHKPSAQYTIPGSDNKGISFSNYIPPDLQNRAQHVVMNQSESSRSLSQHVPRLSTTSHDSNLLNSIKVRPSSYVMDSESKIQVSKDIGQNIFIEPIKVKKSQDLPFFYTGEYAQCWIDHALNQKYVYRIEIEVLSASKLASPFAFGLLKSTELNKKQLTNTSTCFSSDQCQQIQSKQKNKQSQKYVFTLELQSQFKMAHPTSENNEIILNQDLIDKNSLYYFSIVLGYEELVKISLATKVRRNE